MDSISVFAIFRASVRIVDKAKREALARLLLESVVTTPPGEKLDEKLATLTFSNDVTDCKLMHWLVRSLMRLVFQYLHQAPRSKHGGMVQASFDPSISLPCS
jgi:hypothetical protein